MDLRLREAFLGILAEAETMTSAEELDGDYVVLSIDPVSRFVSAFGPYHGFVAASAEAERRATILNAGNTDVPFRTIPVIFTFIPEGQ